MTRRPGAEPDHTGAGTSHMILSHRLFLGLNQLDNTLILKFLQLTCL